MITCPNCHNPIDQLNNAYECPWCGWECGFETHSPEPEPMTKDEWGLKIFLLAFASNPDKFRTENGQPSKALLRDYRAAVLEEANRQRGDNPMSITIRRGLPGIPLSELSEVMQTMARIYDDVKAEAADAQD